MKELWPISIFVTALGPAADKAFEALAETVPSSEAETSFRFDEHRTRPRPVGGEMALAVFGLALQLYQGDNIGNTLPTSEVASKYHSSCRWGSVGLPEDPRENGLTLST